MKWLAYVWTSSIWTMSGTAAGWWLAVSPLGTPRWLPEAIRTTPSPVGAALSPVGTEQLPEAVALGNNGSLWGATEALHLAYGAFSGFLILTLARPLWSALGSWAGSRSEQAEFKRLDVDVRDLSSLLDERTNVLINRIGELRSDVVAGFAGLEMQGTVVSEKLTQLEMHGAIINEKLGALEMQGAVVSEKLTQLGALWQLACAPDVVLYPAGTWRGGLRVAEGHLLSAPVGGAGDALQAGAQSAERLVASGNLWPKIVDECVAQLKKRLKSER